jgi:hypothetical protein
VTESAVGLAVASLDVTANYDGDVGLAPFQNRKAPATGYRGGAVGELGWKWWKMPALNNKPAQEVFLRRRSSR